MSALFNLPDHILPLVGAFLLALSGTWHCMLMCAPISMALKLSGRRWTFYQLGRLFAYLMLGFLVGALGTYAVGWFWGNALSHLFTFALGASFIFIGLFNYKNRTITFSYLKNAGLVEKISSIYQKVYIFWARKSQMGKDRWGLKFLFLGSLSIFLPCGWLYAFLVPTFLVADSEKAALMLLFFWLGTLPGLVLGQLGYKGIQKFPAKIKKTFALVIMFFGFIIILQRSQLIHLNYFPEPKALNRINHLGKILGDKIQQPVSNGDYNCHPAK